MENVANDPVMTDEEWARGLASGQILNILFPYQNYQSSNQGLGYNNTQLIQNNSYPNSQNFEEAYHDLIAARQLPLMTTRDIDPTTIDINSVTHTYKEMTKQSEALYETLKRLQEQKIKVKDTQTSLSSKHEVFNFLMGSFDHAMKEAIARNCMEYQTMLNDICNDWFAANANETQEAMTKLSDLEDQLKIFRDLIILGTKEMKKDSGTSESSDQTKKLCPICFEKEVNMCCVPCGHTVCSECKTKCRIPCHAARAVPTYRALSRYTSPSKVSFQSSRNTRSARSCTGISCL
jgi:hypothetical protein